MVSPSDQALKAIHKAAEAAHLAHREQHAWHVGGTIDRVVTQGVGLPRGTEHHFLVSHQARQPHGVQPQD